MGRYDPDVIAALAEGRLEPDEAVRLEREIAADPAASAELEAQRTALSFLADASPAHLSPAERTDLHSAVGAALGITAESETVEATSTRRVPWGSLGIAAAALAGLVAVVPVVGLLSTDGDDASFDLAAEAPTTSAAAETAPAAEEARDAVVGAVDEDDALTAGDEATEDAAAFGSSTTVRSTTTAPPAAAAAPTTTTTTVTEESATTTAATAEAGADGSGGEGLEALTEELRSVRQDPEAMEALAPTAAEEDATCFVEDSKVRADPPPERYVFEYTKDELTVIIYYEQSEDGRIGPFQVWGLPDCADLVVIGDSE